MWLIVKLCISGSYFDFAVSYDSEGVECVIQEEVRDALVYVDALE